MNRCFRSGQLLIRSTVMLYIFLLYCELEGTLHVGSMSEMSEEEEESRTLENIPARPRWLSRGMRIPATRQDQPAMKVSQFRSQHNPNSTNSPLINIMAIPTNFNGTFKRVKQEGMDDFLKAQVCA